MGNTAPNLQLALWHDGALDLNTPKCTVPSDPRPPQWQRVTPPTPFPEIGGVDGLGAADLCFELHTIGCDTARCGFEALPRAFCQHQL